MERPSIIYVSGPLTTGDNLPRNVAKAISVGCKLIARGYVAIIPHEKLLTEVLRPHGYEYWIEYDFRCILCCDALLRIPGASVGGDREADFARNHGIAVYTDMEKLVQEVPVLVDRVA